MHWLYICFVTAFAPRFHNFSWTDYFKGAYAPPGFYQFGQAVALDGDLLAVSSTSSRMCTTGVWPANQPLPPFGDPPGCSQQGAVYVFIYTSSSSEWTLDALILPPQAQPTLRFGLALALRGTTLAVGTNDRSCDPIVVRPFAEGWDSGDTACDGSGSVLVYTRDAVAGWRGVVRLKAPNVLASGGFGAALVLTSQSLLVAAPGDGSCATGIDDFANAAYDLACSGSGAVQSFNTNDWTFAHFFKSPKNATKFGFFGTSLTGADSMMVVGEPRGSGQVHVYVDSQWEKTLSIESLPCSSISMFGNAVSLSPDASQLLVGAPQHLDTGGGVCGGTLALHAPGAAFVLSTADWSVTAMYLADFGGGGDRFGFDVAWMTNDAVVVMARDEDGCDAGFNGNQTDNGCSDTPVLYLFHNMSQLYYFRSPVEKTSSFGLAMATDALGHRLLVGDPYETGCDIWPNLPLDPTNTGCSFRGAAYLFEAPFPPTPSPTMAPTESPVASPTTTTTTAQMQATTTTSSIPLRPRPPLDSTSSPASSSLSFTSILVIGIVVLCVFFILIVAVAVAARRRHRHRRQLHTAMHGGTGYSARSSRSFNASRRGSAANYGRLTLSDPTYTSPPAQGGYAPARRQSSSRGASSTASRRSAQHYTAMSVVNPMRDDGGGGYAAAAPSSAGYPSASSASTFQYENNVVDLKQ